MTNNNPGGSNAFGNYQLQKPYGDVKKQTALTRAAPISGSPISALETPRRAQRNAGKPPGGQAAPPASPGPLAPPAAPVDPSVVYRQIAQIPGVTPVWRQLLG